MQDTREEDRLTRNYNRTLAVEHGISHSANESSRSVRYGTMPIQLSDAAIHSHGRNTPTSTNRTAHLLREDSVRSLGNPPVETLRSTLPNMSTHSLPARSRIVGGISTTSFRSLNRGGDSQRSIVSTESLLSSYDGSLNEDDERRRLEELETLRLVDEAQDEEILRFALERSITEVSAGSSARTPHLNYEEDDSSGYSLHETGHLSVSPRSRTRTLHSNLPSRSSATASVRASPQVRGSFSALPSGGTAESSRSLVEKSGVRQPSSLAAEFRRTASERFKLAADNDPMDFFDLSPRDEPEFKRVVRVPPPSIGNLDSLSPSEPSVNVASMDIGNAVVTGGTTNPAASSQTRASSERTIDSATQQRPGVVSVKSPAPKVKTPRRGPSAAVSIPAPAPIEKSDDVRAAILAHITSSSVPQRHSVEPPVSMPTPPVILSKEPAVTPLLGTGPSADCDSRDDSQLKSEAARHAVLQLAKSHLPPLEAQLIERALQIGVQQQHSQPLPQQPTASTGSVWQRPLATTNESLTDDWPTLSAQPDRASNLSKAFDVTRSAERSCDLTGNVSSEETLQKQLGVRHSPDPINCSGSTPISSSDQYDFADAEKYLTEDELKKIQQALESVPVQKSSVGDDVSHSFDMLDLSEEDKAAIGQAVLEAEEEEAIVQALRDADDEDERKSLELALKMQRDEELQYAAPNQSTTAMRLQQQGNVRTMTRAEYESQISPPEYRSDVASYPPDSLDDIDLLAAGFRMNSSAQQQWTRRDQNSIVGPNQEVRTKHDTLLHGQANAHRLGLETDEIGIIGNQAFNSFHRAVKGSSRASSGKGSGRTGTSDTNATKGGTMDLAVRGLISRAINNNLIEKCNGIVKEGKEATIYHADEGKESGGFDVAVKVFKRIQEFRGRGDYVDGDPRYGKSTFRALSTREQLRLWAEKEYRNLIRANRAGVPVPVPLYCEENIVFMRFLGTDGWPAPQLRELDLHRGSKRWNTLYAQVIDAIVRLYRDGRLVHGDLSEYNVLVVPNNFIDAQAMAVEFLDEELQAVFIDFGQAVHVNHPSALELLERDIERVLEFFSKQGVETMTKVDVLSLVTV